MFILYPLTLYCGKVLGTIQGNLQRGNGHVRTVHIINYAHASMSFDSPGISLLTSFLLSFQVPLLEPGDIIIDGGNSEYRDTTVSHHEKYIHP